MIGDRPCDTPLLFRDGVLMHHYNDSVLPSVSIHKPVTAGNCSQPCFPYGLPRGKHALTRVNHNATLNQQRIHPGLLCLDPHIVQVLRNAWDSEATRVYRRESDKSWHIMFRQQTAFEYSLSTSLLYGNRSEILNPLPSKMPELPPTQC